MNTVYLGLGSNVGNRENNLRNALEMLSERLTITIVSAIYETEPVGYQNQRRFLNAVSRVTTNFTPGELLVYVKTLETRLGRKPSFRNGPREIDIDILLYGDEVIATPELTVPHPRMLQRAFVLIPLADIAPQLVVPGQDETVACLVERLNTPTGVVKFGKSEETGRNSKSPEG